MNSVTAQSQPTMTLQHYFCQAGVREDLEFARRITINPEMVPMHHQVTGLNQVLAYDRYGIYDEPGAGKTMIAQATALYYAGYKNKIVVVMPPVLLEQFEEQMDLTFWGWREQVSFHILTEGPDARAKLFKQWRETGWPDILCMSYQTFSKWPRQIKRKNKNDFAQEYFGKVVQPGEYYLVPPNNDDYIVGVLKKEGYEYVIADEAHALKNPGSNQHKAVKYLIEDGGGLLLMTGTPIPNELTDAYGLVDLITPGKYASMRSFERLHCVYSTNSDGYSVLVGYQNQDVLTTHLYSRARRVRKEDVLSLLDPQVIEVPINLDPAHYRLYQKLVRERYLEMGDEIINALNQQSLRQKCLRIVTAPEKFTLQKFPNEIIKGVDQLIDSIGLHNEKVVVFATFQESVEVLRDHYIARGFNPAVIYGGKGNNNQEKNKFLKDPTCRVLVANPNSGGVGLNLQSVCRWVIFAEPTSVPGDFKQASERVHRRGQDKVVTIYILKALGTIAPKLTKNMLRKEGETMGVMQDRKSLLDDLMGVAA